MNRHFVLMGVLAVALTAMSASGTVMSLTSLQQISYEGTPAWEYYYDVYADGIAPTQLRIEGFDATELLNTDGGTLYERWDSMAAGYPLWGSGGAGNYPSYRLANGPDEWILSGNPWEMINPIHLPSAYAGVWGNSMYAGTTSSEGVHFWYAMNSGYRDGLYMTIRLVHPWAPGERESPLIKVKLKAAASRQAAH